MKERMGRVRPAPVSLFPHARDIAMMAGFKCFSELFLSVSTVSGLPYFMVAREAVLRDHLRGQC